MNDIISTLAPIAVILFVLGFIANMVKRPLRDMIDYFTGRDDEDEEPPPEEPTEPKRRRNRSRGKR